MTRSQLLAALMMVAISTGSVAAPVKKAKADVVKKAEQKKEEAPVAYKKPTRKKVVKK